MGNDLTPFGGGNGIVPYSGDSGVAPYSGGAPIGGGQSVQPGTSGQDVALFESFAQALTSNGLNGVHQHRAMQTAQRWYTETMQRVNAQEAAMHERQHNQAIIDLRRDWGPDYPTNMRLLHGFLDSIPAETKEFLLESRRDDRAALLNHVPFLTRMVDLLRAERLNSGHPISGEAPRRKQPAEVTAGSETLEELEKMANDRSSKYYRGVPAERNRLQQRYLGLLKQRHGEDDE